MPRTGSRSCFQSTRDNPQASPGLAAAQKRQAALRDGAAAGISGFSRVSSVGVATNRGWEEPGLKAEPWVGEQRCLPHTRGLNSRLRLGFSRRISVSGWLRPGFGAGLWGWKISRERGDSGGEQELQGSEGKAIFRLRVLLRIHLHSLPN